MTIRRQLDRLYSDYGGLDGFKRLLRFAQRPKTTPKPKVKGKPLAMPPLVDKGKGKRS